MTTEDGARPVLMSNVIAAALGVLDRWTLVDRFGLENGTGVASVTEAELLAYPVDRIEWGEPDERGFYEPTLYAKPLEALP